MSTSASSERSAVPARAAVARAKCRVSKWFKSRGWRPFPFQTSTWNAYLHGESGLIHATTGTGKTLAAWLGPVIEYMAELEKSPESGQPKPLRVLWITPLRALAEDTLKALQQPLTDLGVQWTVEGRTGDSSASTRSRQRTRLPTALITTPESLSLLLTRPDAEFHMRDLRLVVCDEWHELLSTKRGVQVELALARLRRWKPQLRTWGLSATLGNLPEATGVLLGSPETVVVAGNEDSSNDPGQVWSASGQGDAPKIRGKLVEGRRQKKVVVDSIIPATIDRFPWAGHLGLKLLTDVISTVESASSTLVFTNTRSQTEAWYQAMLQARPDWAGQIALHHGSLDQETRTWVEDGLRKGTLKAVVCTSSLDLGVDFSPVDRVLQVGSPRGVARLLQRAGRSGHQPGAVSRVTCVPTHALELIEVAAARDAIADGFMESRQSPVNPLDVLCQHAVTIGLGTGFSEIELLEEVRRTWSYRKLSETEWRWILEFLTHGGVALKAYPDFHRLQKVSDRFVVSDSRVARQHRMSIGTIVSDASLIVQYLNGGRLGTVEESFLTRLKPGDSFTFAGRTVELVYVHDMIVWVRKSAKSVRGKIPRWMGGRMPLSTELASAVLRKLQEAANGQFSGPEMTAVRSLLELQAAWSAIPVPGMLLIECVKSREGYHTFFYPFAGRLVHEGLSTLFAWRLAQHRPLTFSMSVNDYGFELLSAEEPPLQKALQEGLFDAERLDEDIRRSLNAAEMGKRQFREIARVSGLVFQGMPGSQKSSRQLQASSGLLYDVFSNYDSENLLLEQSRREVLERQLEHSRLVATLRDLQSLDVRVLNLPRFTPLAFPLLVDRLREQLSSEKLADRIARMQLSLERAAGS